MSLAASFYTEFFFLAPSPRFGVINSASTQNHKISPNVSGTSFELPPNPGKTKKLMNIYVETVITRASTLELKNFKEIIGNIYIAAIGFHSNCASAIRIKLISARAANP